MTPAIKKEQPKGMVLVFALGILALLAILSTTIFVTTMDEAHITSEMQISRKSFTKADLTAGIAVFLARTVLTAESAGTASESLATGGVSSRPEFKVAINNFTQTGFQQIGDNLVTAALSKERYILAADGHATTKRPHVEVFYQYNGDPSKKQLIGTAAVAVGIPALGGSVSGLGEQSYEDGVSTNIVFILVSSNGRVPQTDRNAATVPVDPSNYFTGEGNSKHTVVTTIYRAVL